MQARRAAAAIVALLTLAGCSAGAAGTATVNSAVVVSSAPPATTTTTRSPIESGPAGSTVTSPPVVTTLTVTTVTTAPTPASDPATPSTDLAGEVYGFVTAVDVPGATLTLDKIDWFTGAAARQACAEDGVTDTSNNWCTGYYWRNRNPALRTVAVDPGATITVLDGSSSVPGSLARVAERITQLPSTYRLVVQDGRVTELHEMYAP